MDRYTAAVITSSDGVASGTREDASGDALAQMLRDAGFDVVDRPVVPDERSTIARALRKLADERGVAVVVVTGGTGFAPRDLTPEATRDVIDREAPGLAEAMRAAGRRSTPMADLSRAVCGIRGSTLIVDVPGSPRGATESLAAILDLLPHALRLLAGDTAHPGGTPAPSEETSAGDGSGDPACEAAHHEVAGEPVHGTLVAVYASPVARHLLHFGRDLGYRTVLVDPTGTGSDAARQADQVVASTADLDVSEETDIVVTDHDAPDLGDQLAEALHGPARYIGLMGSPRHEPPHVEPLRERGFGDDEIARVQRPIGLDIGSRTPPEIALATLAGLVAIRTGRSGGRYG